MFVTEQNKVKKTNVSQEKERTMNKKYLPSALILYLNYFIHGVGCSILGQAVIKEALATAWGVEAMAITAISAALGLGRLIALPFAGPLSDKLGRRISTAIGSASYAIYLVGLALAFNAGTNGGYTIAYVCAIVGGIANSFLDTGIYPAVAEIIYKAPGVATMGIKFFIAIAQMMLPFVLGATVATTKESAIKELGYLYDFQAALGGKEITDSNLTSFEGAQGICPKGWHIPTRLEYFNLVGKTTNDADGKVPADGDKALFYDTAYDGAKISSLMDAGFNYQFSGVRMATSLTGAGSYQKTAIADDAKIQAAWHGKPAMNYLMTSTAYKPIYNSTSGLLTNIQFFGLMSTINATKYPEGRLSLSYVSIKAGMQVRCIRDQAGN